MSEDAGIDPLGPFVLGGKVDKPDPARVPLRGDLAHIGLAGRYFVPHYAEADLHVVGQEGADLLADCDSAAEKRATLAAGTRFEVLDVARGFAWGCVSLEGPVGYIALDRLDTAS